MKKGSKGFFHQKNALSRAMHIVWTNEAGVLIEATNFQQVTDNITGKNSFL